MCLKIAEYGSFRAETCSADFPFRVKFTTQKSFPNYLFSAIYEKSQEKNTSKTALNIQEKSAFRELF